MMVGGMDERAQKPNEGGARRRPGGRSARVRRAVLDAAIGVLLDAGPEGFGVPEVAERAGVHKTSVYRRWGDGGALLLDALLTRVEEELPVPDTGSLEGDVLALVAGVAAFLEGPLGGALARTAISVGSDARLGSARREYFSRRFARAAEVFEKAVGRGEIPAGTDPLLAIEALVGPLYLRVLVTGEPLDGDFRRGLAKIVLDGLRETANPRAH